MVQHASPEKYLRSALGHMPTNGEPWDDRHSLVGQVMAAAALSGFCWESGESLAEGLWVRIDLPTGPVIWSRDIGSVEQTPGPDNAARIREYLAGPERT